MSTSARPIIEIDSAPLPADVEALFTDGYVDDSQRLPDMAVLRFRDTDHIVIAKAKAKVGAKLKVSVQTGDAQSPQALFVGEITALEASFDSAGTFTVIRGYDPAHRLFRGRTTHTYTQVTADDVARKIAKRAGLDVGQIASTSTVFDHLSQAGTTDWEFLDQLARDIGYEITVRDGKFSFAPPKSAATAPSGSAPVGGDPLVLHQGTDLLRFRAVLTSAQQVSKVHVRGWDVASKKALVGTAPAATTSADLPTTTPVKLAAAFGSPEYVATEVPYRSQSEVDAAAKALADQIAGSFAEVDALARGNPKLVAGQAIAVDPLGDLVHVLQGEVGGGRGEVHPLGQPAAGELVAAGRRVGHQHRAVCGGGPGVHGPGLLDPGGVGHRPRRKRRDQLGRHPHRGGQPLPVDGEPVAVRLDRGPAGPEPGVAVAGHRVVVGDGLRGVDEQLTQSRPGPGFDDPADGGGQVPRGPDLGQQFGGDRLGPVQAPVGVPVRDRLGQWGQLDVSGTDLDPRHQIGVGPVGQQGDRGRQALRRRRHHRVLDRRAERDGALPPLGVDRGHHPGVVGVHVEPVRPGGESPGLRVVRARCQDGRRDQAEDALRVRLGGPGVQPRTSKNSGGVAHDDASLPYPVVAVPAGATARPATAAPYRSTGRGPGPTSGVTLGRPADHAAESKVPGRRWSPRSPAARPGPSGNQDRPWTAGGETRPGKKAGKGKGPARTPEGARAGHRQAVLSRTPIPRAGPTPGAGLCPRRGT